MSKSLESHLSKAVVILSLMILSILVLYLNVDWDKQTYYHSEKYDFYVQPFSDTSLDYKVIEENLGDRIYLKFVLDASKDEKWISDEFNVFTIALYPINIWTDRMDMHQRLPELSLYLQDKEADSVLDAYLGEDFAYDSYGLYARSNENYYFTWMRGQDCPETLCLWFDEVPEQMRSFTLNPGTFKPYCK